MLIKNYNCKEYRDKNMNRHMDKKIDFVVG